MIMGVLAQITPNIAHIHYLQNSDDRLKLTSISALIEYTKELLTNYNSKDPLRG